MNYKKNIVFYVLILSFIAGIVSQYVRIKGHKENDHWAYYRTAQRIESKNIKEIYNRNDGQLPFRYSPPTLILFSWMANFTETESRHIWLIIQAVFIAAGLWLINRILLQTNSPSPINSITFSFLLFYRYFLDALFCGQLAGVFFFFLTLGLYYLINNKKNFSNLALFFLFMLKIVPGFLIILNFLKSKNWRDLARAATYLFIGILIIQCLYFFWFVTKFGLNNISEFFPSYMYWINIVLADKDYFDGSTAKSQAVRGVLLRLFGNSEQTESLWKIISLISLITLFTLWYKLKNFTIKTQIYSYSLGVLTFVLLMPQSLPYQIFMLLIPVVFIMSDFLATSKKEFGILLVFVLIFCTLPTSDIIGKDAAEFVQYRSLPFLSFIFMGVVILKEIFSLNETGAE